MNFPSVMYFWEAQRARRARAHGADRRRDRRADRAAARRDRRRDALVPISHVIFRSSFIQTMPSAIVEKAHTVGAHVVLDAFQSLGTVPVDVRAQRRLRLRRRAEVAMRRPRAALPLRAPRSGATLQPGVHGLDRAHDPFGFEVGRLGTRDPSYRFMNGTPNVPALTRRGPASDRRRRGREAIRAEV